MRTIKRNVNQIDTSLSSYNKTVKYFNQLEWKGIIEGNNQFNIDQLSFKDSKNVYVDDDGVLVSRNPLIEDKLSEDLLPIGYKLIDIIVYNKFTVYISRNIEDNLIRITINGIATLSNINNYNLSTIDNYIICFNNIGAKIFDINHQELGWQNFSKFVEVPVIKRVIGNLETNYSKNQFTESYKEEYIVSNTSNPTLPTFSNKYDDKYLTNMLINSNKNWKVWKPNILTQYRILKPINYKLQEGDLFSAAKGRICIGKEEYMLFSLDNGNTFTKVLYPAHGKWLNIASISDDGGYYFFVASDAVYRLDLGSLNWTVIYPHLDNTKSIGDIYSPIYNDKDNGKLWHFLTKDIFAFVLWTDNNNGRVTTFPILWFQGPNLAGYDTVPDLTANVSDSLISDEYRGTLGCSIALAREALANINVNNGFSSIAKPASITQISLKDNSANLECIPTLLKIILDNGPVYVEGSLTDKGTVTGGRFESKNYATIFISSPSILNGENSVFGISTYILSGANCPDYIYNDEHLTEPLNLRISISNLPKHGYSTFVGFRNYNTNDYSPQLSTLIDDINLSKDIFFDKLRIEKVYNSTNWEIGDYKGKSNNDNNFSKGVFTINGKVHIQDNINSNNRWCDFIWQIGYNTVDGIQKLYSFISIGTEYKSYKVEHSLINDFNINAYYTSILDTNGVPIKLDSNTMLISSFLRYDINNDINDIFINDYMRTKYKNNKGNIVNDSNFYMIMSNGIIYTNILNDNDIVTITYDYLSKEEYTKVPNKSYTTTDLYLVFDNKLSITNNTKDVDGNLLFNLPIINNQTFINNITNLINISTTDIAIFFENNIIICSKVQDDNLQYRYDYYPTKLSTGTRLGDNIINTIEGTYTIFPTKRGLAFMNYQAFMATSDQILTYISDNISDIYTEFYNNSKSIYIIQFRNKLYLTNNTRSILIYDLTKNTWWNWEVPCNINKLVTNQIDLSLISDKLYKFSSNYKVYKDFQFTSEESRIDWFIISQPLHMNAPNYYKNLKQLVFQFSNNTVEKDLEQSITVQIRCYRNKLSTKQPELISFNINELSTFVKRFNYWKINEIQYALADDWDTIIPIKLNLNAISIKYEIGEEVR